MYREFMAQGLHTKHVTELSDTDIQSFENFELCTICVTVNMMNTKPTISLNQLTIPVRTAIGYRNCYRPTVQFNTIREYP